MQTPDLRSRLWPLPVRLADLRENGFISALDLHFAGSMAAASGERDDDVLLATALASRAVGAGHVCLELRTLDRTPANDLGQSIDLGLPAAPELENKLRQSRIVSPIDHLLEIPGSPRPLLIDPSGRLYLNRLAVHQARLARNLLDRARERFSVDERRLQMDLARFFPAGVADDLARLAALIAARSGLAVIAGGPGTGKTTIVARLLALLQLQNPGSRLRVLLLAPTGKAAARLQEALEASLGQLGLDPEVAATLAHKPSTIHRALGYRRVTPGRFRHDATHPLPADVVLVDEASMIDLTLMAKLVDAVPRSARLILLGDKDQLASVEAGAIFGDICQSARARACSSEWSEAAARIAGVKLEPSQEPPGLQDCMVQLTKSYRYAEGSAIARLARAVTSGSSAAVIDLLRRSATRELRWIAPDGEGEDSQRVPPALHAVLREGFRSFFAAKDPLERLTALAEFRILCAHRRGPGGVQAMNRWVERELLPSRPNGDDYAGRPILITENDYQLELFNGDVGVLGTDADGRLRAYFATRSGLRSFLPSRLPAHETVFAMTVHMSQGSELAHVAIVLPPEASAVVTRELLYTAVTRAKQSITLYGTEAVVASGVSRRLERASGLIDALHSR